VGVLIDTSILIGYERGKLNLPAQTANREEAEAFVSVITVSELLHGAHRAVDSGVKARRFAFIEGLLTRFAVLEIDLETARAHAQLWAMLTGKGQMIGVHDSWLAATCIARDLTLATANVREFERVPGLRVEDWTASELQPRR
jgi:tRNA(fMet)-specific endonuclease VapC